MDSKDLADVRRTLWAGEDAAIGGESALVLWELADVNPRPIELVVPPGQRVRRRDAARFRLKTERLAPVDIDFVEGIPVVRPEVTTRQVIDQGTEGNLVEQAITNASRRNLLKPLAEARLRVSLADRNLTRHRRRPYERHGTDKASGGSLAPQPAASAMADEGASESVKKSAISSGLAS